MNAINWFEIPSHDFNRATAFYEALYAETLRLDTDFPGMKMAILPHGDEDVGGAVVHAEHLRPSSDGMLPYLNAGADLAQMLGRVEAAGGAIIMPKTHLGEKIGYIAIFRDSEGNHVGLHSMN
ncbi:VOC family protein [Parachitinimonas caeni]|uniref:VOC family protein n=1 Tax=Parachitinimonas caeni TaxID=3031301 RepID=A0ABT7DWK0_9NEIS|nr:VOC family protein [Parachitinimonas caeni]MDK2124425.1 VOC family protein [Parachitinimonas caeni]